MPVDSETSLFKNKQKMLELCKPVKEMWKKRKKNLCEEHKKTKKLFTSIDKFDNIRT